MQLSIYNEINSFKFKIPFNYLLIKNGLFIFFFLKKNWNKKRSFIKYTKNDITLSAISGT